MKTRVNAKTDKMIINLYNHILEYRKSRIETGITINQYAIRHGMCKKEISNTMAVFGYEERCAPDFFNKMSILADEYEGSEFNSIGSFSIYKNIKKTDLEKMMRYRRYKRAIDKYEGKNNKMELIAIKPKKEEKLIAMNRSHEYMPKSDLEITITQGIKVIVAANVDTMKIVKIIDLLKDL